jgi:hypothetical protein
MIWSQIVPDRWILYNGLWNDVNTWKDLAVWVDYDQIWNTVSPPNNDTWQNVVA